MRCASLKKAWTTISTRPLHSPWFHNLSREVNTALARKQVKADNQRELLDIINRIDSVLNIFGEQQREILDSEIQALLDQRQEARRRRDFARADEIRRELADRGIILEDTKDGVRWKRFEVLVMKKLCALIILLLSCLGAAGLAQDPTRSRPIAT